jgi:ATP-dependent helicase/nuclease subunit A
MKADAARDSYQLVAGDLDRNVLVEAGAGTGKTTLLIARMLAQIERGIPLSQMVAVTFTVKAANELRERLQEALERRLRQGALALELYQKALEELDGCFVGTIHAFCARLLRERPLEVGLEPGFRVLDEEAWPFMKEQFWSTWVAAQHFEGSLKSLLEAGIDPADLRGAFELLVENPDVDFLATAVPTPDIGDARTELEELLEEARALIPPKQPDRGWDKMQKRLRYLSWHMRHHDWNRVANFFHALESACRQPWEPTLNRWEPAKKEAARDLAARLQKYCSRWQALLVRWYEYRYPLVMEVLQKAVRAFEKQRLSRGELAYVDLLVQAAKLLRESADARRELGGRWRYLHVDEFQDTDPLQAEILFLLASEPRGDARDWRAAVPRPGALFVVGDPKQSIYRFRRADIATYSFIRGRFDEFGVVLPLERTHRCRPAVAQFVNSHFRSVFSPETADRQALFQEMVCATEMRLGDGVFLYRVEGAGGGGGGRATVLASHADAVAGWIAEQLAGGRQPEDFLVLTYRRDAVAYYARALAARNIAVSTAGAQFSLELELRELLAILGALADPGNPVKVAAALEGLCFGLSPADLYEGAGAGLEFSIAKPREGHCLMAKALSRLHEWWLLSRRVPPDILVERILDQSGILLYATAQPLGESRAGALGYVVELLRSERFLRGDVGLAEAVQRIEALCQVEVPDTPLRPFRAGTVRVMNLHRAKGLEAEVVILADPSGYEPKQPLLHVRRLEDERAIGFLHVTSRGGVTIARPVGWADYEGIEAEFLEAERTRLLYVAATRARGQLLVPASNDHSSRASFWITLASQSGALPVIELQAGQHTFEPPLLHLAGAELEQQARYVQDTLSQLCQGGLKRESVSAVAKEEGSVEHERETAGENSGAAWGRAVHRAIEGFGGGRRDSSLRSYIEAVARDEGLDQAEVGRLWALIQDLAASARWQELMAGVTVRFELPLMFADRGSGKLVEGVLDAAALGDAGWQVVDWKTDASDAEWRQREPQYTTQVQLYAKLLEASTGVPAKASLVRLPLPGEP